MVEAQSIMLALGVCLASLPNSCHSAISINIIYESVQ